MPGGLPGGEVEASIWLVHNGMASMWSYKNQSSSYRGKFRWIFDQGKGNLARVGGEIEVSELELTE